MASMARLKRSTLFSMASSIGSIDTALLLIAAYMQIAVVMTAIGQAMDEPGVTVEVEDDGLVHGEQAIEIAIAETVGVFLRWRYAEKIHHVDEAHLEVREVL